MEADPQAPFQPPAAEAAAHHPAAAAADAVRREIGTDTAALLAAARQLTDVGRHVEETLRTAEKRSAALTALTGLRGQTGAELIAAIRELDQAGEPASLAAIKTLKRTVRLRHTHAPLLDAAIQAGIPALLYGASGSGKTTAVRHTAEAFDVRFAGNSVAHLPPAPAKPAVRPSSHPFSIQDTVKNGGIFLFDDLSADQPELLRTVNALVDPSLEKSRHKHTRFAAATEDTTGWVAQALSRFITIPWPTDWDLIRARRHAQPAVPITEVDITEGGLPDAEQWLTTVERYAAAAERAGLSGHVTAYSEDYGARLSAHGVGLRWLKELCIYRGLGEYSRTQLEQALNP